MITWFKIPIVFEIDCFHERSHHAIEDIRIYMKENKIKHKFKWVYESDRVAIIDTQLFRNLMKCMKIFDRECRQVRINAQGMMSHSLANTFLQMDLQSYSQKMSNGEHLKLYVYNENDAITLKLMFTEWIYKI